MMAASLGSLAIAAHQILHNAYMMTFLPGIGFTVAGITLVGQFLGAEKKEKALKSGLETARMALLVMSAVGLVFLFFPGDYQYLYPGCPCDQPGQASLVLLAPPAGDRLHLRLNWRSQGRRYPVGYVLALFSCSACVLY